MEMKFDGEFKIDLPREEVFEILSDPEKFAPLFPTFHSMEMKDERTANLKVKVGIGKIIATSTTELTLEETVPGKMAGKNHPGWQNPFNRGWWITWLC